MAVCSLDHTTGQLAFGNCTWQQQLGTCSTCMAKGPCVHVMASYTGSTCHGQCILVGPEAQCNSLYTPQHGGVLHLDM